MKRSKAEAHDHDVAQVESKSESHAQSMIEQIEYKLKDAGVRLDEIQEQVKDVSDKVIETTKNKPVLALGVAVAVGVLLGKLFK